MVRHMSVATPETFSIGVGPGFLTMYVCGAGANWTPIIITPLTSLGVIGKVISLPSRRTTISVLFVPFS